MPEKEWLLPSKKDVGKIMSSNDILVIDDDIKFLSYLKHQLEDHGYHVIIALSVSK